ncbi:AAA family ATPase [Microlunatus lacustris]
MPRVLLTGMSGTGKSTLAAELARRGHRTVETDDDGWHREDGSWHPGRMTALLDAHPDLLVVGTADNQGRFYDRFAAVVLLSVPADVVLARVSTRSTNPYGRSGEQRAEILGHLSTVEPLLRRGATLELDGRRPTGELADVVAQLLTSG